MIFSNNLTNKLSMFSSITKKSLMAVSGAALGSFIVVHTIGNLTAFFGKEAFLAYAHHLHSLGIFVNLFEISMLAVFLVHLIFGATLFWENFHARPQGYLVKKNDGGRTLGSQSMPYTGILILIFIFVHLNGFHFADKSIPVNEVLLQNFNNPLLSIFYIISLIALIFHTSHGFWSLFQSLGINHPKYNLLLEKGAMCLSILTGTVFILIPISVLLCDSFLK